MVWAVPRSLAATRRITVVFFSWGYLDVSVRPVRSVWAMCSPSRTWALSHVGFPIQVSPDQSLFGGSPRLIAAFNAFLRRPTPRHPPSALSSLATKLENPYFGLGQNSGQRIGFVLVALFYCQRTLLLGSAISPLGSAASPRLYWDRPMFGLAPCRLASVLGNWHECNPLGQPALKKWWR